MSQSQLFASHCAGCVTPSAIERLGDLYRDHGLVFTSEVGTVINPTNLRHTCATLLLVRNVNPTYVQDLLGHATVAITLDTYSHVIPGMGNPIARAIEDAFS